MNTKPVNMVSYFHTENIFDSLLTKWRRLVDTMENYTSNTFPRKNGEIVNTTRVNNLYLSIYVPLKLGGWYREAYMDQLHFILRGH